MKKILVTLLLALSATTTNAKAELQKIDSTKNEAALLKSSQGWSKTMGFRPLYTAAESPKGDFVAVISSAHGPDVDLPGSPTNNQNTLYLLNGKTGLIIFSKNFLLDSKKTAWANTTYQWLNVKFEGDQLVISGELFSGSHPEKIPFSKTIDLPSLPDTNDPVEPPSTSKPTTTATKKSIEWK
jgi:hypothetical protein